MRGTTKSAFPYILDDDKENPLEEQTIINIKPWGGLDGAKISARYASTERLGRKNYPDVHVGKRKKADEQSFLEVVDSVENYAFSEDFPQFQKKNENGSFEISKKGFMKLLDTSELILAFANDLTLDQYNEIIEAAANAGRLSAEDKKKLK